MTDNENQLAEDLRAAKALIDTPEKWLQGSSVSPDGKRRCAMGALWVIPTGPSNRREEAFWVLRDLVAPLSIPQFNDVPDRAHDEIMDLFDRAIAEALR